MQRICFFLFLFPLFVSAQKTFEIDGSISGFSDTPVKITDANNNNDIASGKITNGKFILKGSVEEPTLCRLVIGSDAAQYIYVENKKITVTGSKANVQHLKVTGSASHNDFVKFQETFNPLMVSLSDAVTSINKSKDREEYDKLMKVYDSIRAVIQTKIDAFVDARPKSAVTPFVLLATSEIYDDPLLLEKRYNKLDASVKNLAVGKNLYHYIQYNKVGAIGTEAIDFTQPDTTGKPVALSSFRGKYVLVDFWASWCGPCRAENPNVVRNFNEFKGKNFTVLGVSLDRPNGKENWLNAIHHDNLTWTHVSDLQYWNNAAAQLYHVQSIPFNMLIDPTGKIIAKNLRSDMLHSKLCEVLGCD
jgi:peroxiredoxin